MIVNIIYETMSDSDIEACYEIYYPQLQYKEADEKTPTNNMIDKKKL